MKQTTMKQTKSIPPASTQWYLIDATEQIVGRLASQVAYLLMGKHRTDWNPHWSSQDKVIIINAHNVAVTGKKRTDKWYYRHSGYPGGIKKANMQSVLHKTPPKVLEHAIKGMLPKNKLGRALYRNVAVYATPQHPHESQKPIVLQGRLNKVQDLYAALNQAFSLLSAQHSTQKLAQKNESSLNKEHSKEPAKAGAAPTKQKTKKAARGARK